MEEAVPALVGSGSQKSLLLLQRDMEVGVGPVQVGRAARTLEGVDRLRHVVHIVVREEVEKGVFNYLWGMFVSHHLVPFDAPLLVLSSTMLKSPFTQHRETS